MRGNGDRMRTSFNAYTDKIQYLFTVNILQAFSVVRFLFQYIIPVSIFAFCYGRIFHTIRRQSKVVGVHAGRTQDVPMATTSRDPNAGQVQQQATGATTDHQKLSHTEMNVIKTMITVIVCYLIFWTVPTIASLLQLLWVSIMFVSTT